MEASYFYFVKANETARSRIIKLLLLRIMINLDISPASRRVTPHQRHTGLNREQVQCSDREEEGQVRKSNKGNSRPTKGRISRPDWPMLE